MDSVLTSIKKTLGIVEEYTHFDEDLIMHINSVLSILNQSGRDVTFVNTVKFMDALPNTIPATAASIRQFCVKYDVNKNLAEINEFLKILSILLFFNTV